MIVCVWGVRCARYASRFILLIIQNVYTGEREREAFIFVACRVNQYGKDNVKTRAKNIRVVLLQLIVIAPVG